MHNIFIFLLGSGALIFGLSFLFFYGLACCQIFGKFDKHSFDPNDDNDFGYNHIEPTILFGLICFLGTAIAVGIIYALGIRLSILLTHCGIQV